ncbi:MAG: histidine phosphatase family protein [Flavobacteriales bacterium]|nr:histidine phosphatase family protein [Flavobacteriales bacterium]
MAATAAERRYWPQYPDDAYTLAEWREFVKSRCRHNATMDYIDAETTRLWNIAKTRLCDQPTTPWVDVLAFKEAGGIVAVISARRAYVPGLKPALHKDGIVTTCGQPGDAMSGLRSQDPDSWVYPWLAKTIGCIAGLVHLEAHRDPSGQPKVWLVYCSAEMGTGSQTEWEELENLTRRITVEVDDVDFSMDHAVVDPYEVMQHYDLDPDSLDAAYYQARKTIHFVRHGQSISAVAGDMLDPPLSALGERQSFELGQKRKFCVDSVVCSPHVRTLQTLKYLPVTCNHAFLSSTVAEFNRRELQNRVPSVNMLPHLPDQLNSANLQVEVFVDEDGLDNADLKVRALKRLANFPGTSLLVVTHGSLIHELTNLDVGDCGVVACTLEQGSIEGAAVVE